MSTDDADGSDDGRRRDGTQVRREVLGDALLEHAGADALLAVLTAPRLEDARLDALQLEQPAERQPGGAGADDPDLRPQSVTCSSTLKALFAAGTPQ